jgi:GntR family transcriptional regulator of vanillate catabolism
MDDDHSSGATLAATRTRLVASRVANSEGDAHSLIPRLQRTRLLDEVTRALRELIISNALPPGTPLRQSDLAQRLGVSRTPLREALRVLEADGLVVVSNKSRTVEVVSVTLPELIQMYELRRVIDGLAARLAATAGLSPEAEEQANLLMETMIKSRSPYDPAARTDAHARLHSLFAELSGNTYVAAMAPMIRMSGAWLYHPFATDSEDLAVVADGMNFTLAESMARSDAFHLEILQAIIDRDADRAEDAAMRHIENTTRAIRIIAKLDDERQTSANHSTHDESGSHA